MDCCIPTGRSRGCRAKVGPVRRRPSPPLLPPRVPAANANTGLAVLNSGDPAVLELHANQTFDRGQYALALPMLLKVADHYKDNPEKLGPTQEKIRVCQKNLATAVAASVSATAQQPAIASSDEQHASPIPLPKPGETVELDIKQLGNFDYDISNGGNIPKDVIHLNGVKLRTHSFMIPLDQADNISEFALVPSLFSCCFGQPPQVATYHSHSLPQRQSRPAISPMSWSSKGTLKWKKKR